MANYPKIEDAKKLGKKYNMKKVIIMFETSNGEFGYAEWGKNQGQCTKAKKLADELFCTMEEQLQRIG